MDGNGLGKDLGQCPGAFRVGLVSRQLDVAGRCLQIFMSKKFLDYEDVGTAFVEQGPERMFCAVWMTTARFDQSSSGSILEDIVD